MSERLQVGGTHYETSEGYEHWDWIADISLGYLEGCATKYVMRWRSKNGLEDLRKARTYVLKIVALYNAGNYMNNSFMNEYGTRGEHHTAACEATGKILDQMKDSSEAERSFMVACSQWYNGRTLNQMCGLIETIISAAEEQLAQQATGTGKTPPTPPQASTAGQHRAGQGTTGQANTTSATTASSSSQSTGQEHPFGYQGDE